MLAARSIPNILSISRIPLGLLLVVVYDPTDKLLFYIAVGIILTALLTDIVDGKLARFLKCTSLKGYMLDGLGDKAFCVAFLVVILREHPVAAIIVWLLIVREIAMYALRVVSSNLSDQLKHLRIHSLMHALWIRLCFLCVLIHDTCVLNGTHIPLLLPSALLLSLLACLSGGIGLTLQIKAMLLEREPCRSSSKS